MKTLFEKLRKFWIEDVSFITLLIMLIFIIFIIPTLLHEELLGVLFLNIMFILIFFIGIWSSIDKTWIIIASVLFLSHVTLKIFRLNDSTLESYLAEKIFSCLNVLAFIFINLRLLFRDDFFNIYRIIGAVNVYLLIALFGAFAFHSIDMIFGSSIDGDVILRGNEGDFVEYIYFSLSSLTTVGYGDINPVNPTAKMLSVFLSAIGLLFPSIVIARLVSLTTMKKDIKTKD